MKLTIRTDILQQEHLSLADFLVLLMGFCEVDYQKTLSSLAERGIIQSNVFNPLSPILSDNTKTSVSDILIRSDDSIASGSIDYHYLAKGLQLMYPEGKKSGTSYDWRGYTQEIARKLMTLVSRYGFSFTEEEALAATQEYVSSFREDRDKTNMHLLKYFILKTTGPDHEIDSPFMTIIENNRYTDKTTLL